MNVMTLAGVWLGLLGMTAAPGATAQHVHQHQAELKTTVTRAPTQRWMPDPPLSAGMRRAFTAVDQLKHYEIGHMSRSMAVDRAGEVVDAVSFMFAHCQLAAEPDTALHGILLPLLGAAQALKADPKKLSAVAEMRTAIARYPEYFNDPGWDTPMHVMQDLNDEP